MEKLLILYTELANYTIACLEELAISHKIDTHVVHYNLNPEAPFKFETSNKNLKFYKRELFDEKSLISLTDELAPNLLYCAGWADKNYLATARFFKKKGGKTLLGFDNQWNGNLKQVLSSIYARFIIKPLFDYAFVPGNRQVDFALKLGFKENKIIEGAYSADVNSFSKFHDKQKQVKQASFPKRFIFVGRYVHAKGLQLLWEAFIEVNNEGTNKWELWCLGVGPIKQLANKHIKHLGFVQPKQLENILEQTGVFVLPSVFEPWGVVVHEFAAAGFPIIASTNVGASDTFVSENRNGIIFQAENKEELKRALKKIIDMSDDDLLNWSAESNKLSKQITTSSWANSLNNIIKN